MIFSVYGVCFSDYIHEKCIAYFDTPISTGFLVSPHFMRGRELSTLVVILSVCHSVIMGSHFQIIKREHRVLYSH